VGIEQIILTRDPPPHLRGLVSRTFAYSEGGVAMRAAIEPAGLDIPFIVNFGTPFEIALGRQPQIAREVTGAHAVGAMNGEPKPGSFGQHMAFIAAGGFANDEHPAKAVFPIAACFPAQDPPDGYRSIGNCLLPVGWEDVKRQTGFGDFESDDMLVRL